jgi:diaminohydroxyphosphoribosylaminopyrimidine deaminase / 5-amino-6-(5-phosphoribosylamino)uracil reductase
LKTSRLATLHKPENIFFVTSKKISVAPFNLVQVPVDQNNHLDLKAALTSLKSLGVHSILVEGGSATYSGFLQSRLFQRLHLFQAPLVLGKGLGWSAKMTVPDLASGLRLQKASVERLGEDIYFSARVLDQSRN